MTKTYLKETDFYLTDSICLAAALSCQFYQIEIDQKNYSKIAFLVKRDEYLDNFLQRYFTHELRVNPASYFYCFKELEDRIYNTESI